jgi:hypothetical protein
MSKLVRLSVHSLGVATLATALLGSGCATVLKGKTTPVSVTSTTAGATVMVNGQPAGVTPTTVQLSNTADAVITVRQADKEETCRMTSGASTGWVVADVLLTTGLGIIVDWATHNWNNVGPSSCHTSV